MRRPRLLRIFLLSAVLSVVSYLVVSTRMGERQRSLAELQRKATGCVNLSLGMTHDDVVNRMGTPSAETETGPRGDKTLVMVFSADRRPELAYPRVTLQRGVLIEAVCGELPPLAASEEEKAKMFEVLAREDTLGQDAVRP